MEIMKCYFNQSDEQRDALLIKVSSDLGFAPAISTIAIFLDRIGAPSDRNFCESLALDLKAHLVPHSKRSGLIAVIKAGLGDSPGRASIKDFYSKQGERKSLSYCAAIVAVMQLERRKVFETIPAKLRASLPPNPSMEQVAQHVEAFGLPRPSDYATRKLYSALKQFPELWLSRKGQRNTGKNKLPTSMSDDVGLDSIVSGPNFRKITFSSVAEEMALDAIIKSAGLSASSAVSMALNSFLLVVARGQVDFLQLVRDAKNPNFSELKHALNLLAGLNLRGI